MTDGRVIGVAPGFEDRLRRLRTARGYTPTQLGKRGVNGADVRAIESGSSPVTDEAAARFARRLSCPLRYLTQGVPDERIHVVRSQLAMARSDLTRDAPRAALRRFTELLADPAVIVVPGLFHTALLGSAAAHEELGRPEAAMAQLRQLTSDSALPVGSRLWAEAHAALSRCYHQAGELNRAVKVASTALARIDSTSRRNRSANLLVCAQLLTVVSAAGRRALARRVAVDLLSRLDRTVTGPGRSAALWAIAWHAAGTGAVRTAVRTAGEAFVVDTRDRQASPSRLVLRYADLLVATQDEKASARAVAALRAGAPPRSARPQVSVPWRIALIQAQTGAGDVDAAFAECPALLLDAEDAEPVLRGRAWIAVGDVLADRGDADSAAAHLDLAAELLDATNAVAGVQPVRRALAAARFRIRDNAIDPRHHHPDDAARPRAVTDEKRVAYRRPESPHISGSGFSTDTSKSTR